MKELRVRLKGLTEEDARRLRRSQKRQAVSSRALFGLVGVVAVAYVMTTFRPEYLIHAFRVDTGGTLSGDCSGTIKASQTRGYAGEEQNVTIRIEPRFQGIITKVTTNNPGCQNCDAVAMGPGQFVFRGRFEGTGPFRIEFLAKDKTDLIRCRGETEELVALGKKP